MPVETVAIISPGDMGHAVGRLLRENGLRVITCLAGRSPRTRGLSQQAGIADVPTLDELVQEADILLSITVSEAVPGLCKEVAGVLRRTGADLLFAECNAIAPQLSRDMEKIITGAGGRYVDASIIGGPPKDGHCPRFYASGPNAVELQQLEPCGLDVRVIGPEVGQASGIKMCYAALTKGSAALQAQLLMAAEIMGLSKPLQEEFENSEPTAWKRMEGFIPALPARSRRWVSEMLEIEATFGGLGLTPHIFQGVAEMYRLIGSSPYGEETPETRDLSRTCDQTIRRLVEHLQGMG